MHPVTPVQGAAPAYVGLRPSTVNVLLVSVLERVTGLGPGRVLVESETRPRPGTHAAGGLYCTLGWKLLEPLPQNVGDLTFAPEPLPLPGEEAGAEGETGPDLASQPTGHAGGLQHLLNETWCVVDVSFWGTGALDAAARAVSSLQSNERQFDLWRTLGFGGVGSIRDESAPYGGKIQPRVFFDLSFYACFGASYPADWFDVSQWDLGPLGEPELIIPDPEPCPQKP